MKASRYGLLFEKKKKNMGKTWIKRHQKKKLIEGRQVDGKGQMGQSHACSVFIAATSGPSRALGWMSVVFLSTAKRKGYEPKTNQHSLMSKQAWL